MNIISCIEVINNKYHVRIYNRLSGKQLHHYKVQQMTDVVVILAHFRKIYQESV